MREFPGGPGDGRSAGLDSRPDDPIARGGPPRPDRVRELRTAASVEGGAGFYVAPTKRPVTRAESIADRRPGHLIRSEPFDTRLPGSKAGRILYVSTGLDGLPIEVSGLVVDHSTPPAET